MRDRLTVVVSGMVAAVPFHGGATWAVLQYLLGLRDLGHRVYFVEQVPETALRPHGVGIAQSVNAEYFLRVMGEFGFDGSVALLQSGTAASVGLSYSELLRTAGKADLLLNLAGTLTDSDLTANVPLRAYVDLDPGFTQLWHAVEGIDMRFEGHNRFVSVGQAIGREGCDVPSCGLDWIPTLPPVFLSAWPVGLAQPSGGRLTTVANWRGYGSIKHEGVFYGQKVHSLRRFLELPMRAGARFDLALAIHPNEERDLAALRQHGWGLADPQQVAGTPSAYRDFVQGSWAEFGIAKSGYVEARCGWFSDRSACYLASGRPVIAQDTGFSPYVPAGEGLLCFRTVEDVLAAIEELRHNYHRHAEAARALAEEYFDSRKVIGDLIDRLVVA